MHPSALPGKSKGETHNLQISVKLTKDVFLVPTLTTCGGFMTNFLFSPATMSGFFSLMMLKTLLSNCKGRSHSHVSTGHSSKHLTSNSTHSEYQTTFAQEHFPSCSEHISSVLINAKSQHCFPKGLFWAWQRCLSQYCPL